MKIQATILLVTFLSFSPLAANAQAAININLNDVMVSQRRQEMSNLLNSYSTVSVKPKHEKRSKKNKDRRVAVMQKTDDQSADQVVANSEKSAATNSEQSGF